MINIKQDPEFYELVNDVEKLLIYTLDSATLASGKYTNWIEEYRGLDYEEYVYMSGKVDLILLGKEDEYVGLTASDGKAAAFYLRGSIAFQKIPKLVQTFESGDMLNVITNQLDR